MEVKIYCLYDPISCKIRYIGRTSKKILEHRLIEHISKSKYFERYYPEKKLPHRVNWIKSLLTQGYEPKIKLLKIVNGWQESHQEERRLINKYKDKFDLVNLEDRGEGNVNKIVTQEQKEKISKTLKQYYIQGGQKTNCSRTYVYNIEGVFLKEFDTRTEAAKYADTDKKQLSKCFRTDKYKRKHINGFRFSNEKFDRLPSFGEI
jgi:hypothetical protein